MIRALRLLSSIMLALFAAIAMQPRAQAAIVAPGFDLLTTQPGTAFLGAPFQGVPLGTFDFGAPFGVLPTGDTDTIVQRLGPASVLPPGSDTIPIELVALHLVSVVPVDLGAGLGMYYVTLQSERGGPQSVGEMTIGFSDDNGGSFDSFFDVFFDIRFGALNGPIVFSEMLNMTAVNVPWGRIPPPGALLIEGVNFNLDGSGNKEDFFPIGPFTEQHPGIATHVVTPTPISEPATLALIGLGLAGLGVARRRKMA